jgi:hypothetical protein
MTTQVTIKNNGPHKVTVKSWYGDDENNRIVTGIHTLTVDQELTIHVWKYTRYSIEEEVEDVES